MFDAPGTVNLVGTSIFFDLLESERILLKNGLLALEVIKLRWVVMGEAGSTCLKMLSSIGERLEDWVALQPIEDESYDNQFKSYRRYLEAQEALIHFTATVKRNSESSCSNCH